MVVFWRQDPADSTVPPRTVLALYVGSGKSGLHWYAKQADESAWDCDEAWAPGQPEGGITSLAATRDYLYALCKTGALWRIDKSADSWEKISFVDSRNYPHPQSIFSSEDVLFVGSRPSKDDLSRALFYLADSDSGNALKYLRSGAYSLNGAAFDGSYHYLSTHNLKDGGGRLLRINNTFSEVLELDDEGKGNFNIGCMSIICLKHPSSPASPSIVSIDRSGNIYRVNNTGFSSLDKKMGTKFIYTGTLAQWCDPLASNMPVLLLAGSDGSATYNYGYREIDLTWSGSSLNFGSFHEPGKGGPVKDNEQYLSSLGNNPVHHLFQAPSDVDESMTLFASTANNGLWSYRSRDDKAQWNAEE
jgi:hypothetical protein